MVNEFNETKKSPRRSNNFMERNRPNPTFNFNDSSYESAENQNPNLSYEGRPENMKTSPGSRNVQILGPKTAKELKPKRLHLGPSAIYSGNPSRKIKNSDPSNHPAASPEVRVPRGSKHAFNYAPGGEQHDSPCTSDDVVVKERPGSEEDTDY